MRFITTWWAHRVNLGLTEPVTNKEQWRRVMDADQVTSEILTLEDQLKIARTALRWIALGPTWGPGAPSSSEQAARQSECARDALVKLEARKK